MAHTRKCAYDFCVDSPRQGGGKLTPLLTTKPLTLCEKIVPNPTRNPGCCPHLEKSFNLRGCIFCGTLVMMLLSIGDTCLRCLRWDSMVVINWFGNAWMTYGRILASSRRSNLFSP